MRFGSLFSGIGGLDLGLERAGMTCVWQVEIDEWCRSVLARHWPDVPRWDDVRTFTPSVADANGTERGQSSGERPRPVGLGGETPGRVRGVSGSEHIEGWRGGSDYRVDLICGGFPCQPVSLAGKRRGQDDERWLWPEFARIIRLLRPRVVLVENVPGLLARGMGDVLGDLAACGYDTEWDCIPAAAVGAPHLRYRVFIVAYAQGLGRSSVQGEPDSETLVGAGACSGRRARGGDSASGVRVGGRVESDGSLVSADADSRGFEGERSSGLLDGERSPLGDDPDGRDRPVPDANELRRNGWPGIFGQGWRPEPENGGWWATEPDVGRVAHGVPRRVDRLRGLGNAVVPQVAEWIGRRLMEVAS